MIRRSLTLLLLALLGAASAHAAEDSFTLPEIMSYPFPRDRKSVV